jgi:hypothetical protein
MIPPKRKRKPRGKARDQKRAAFDLRNAVNCARTRAR